MVLRYLVLFVGVVFMINGCNSLISQQFGTHRLRTLSFREVVERGVGDADFIEINDVLVGEALVNSPRSSWLDANYVFRPVLTPEQDKAWRSGATVTTQVIAWYNVDTTDCLNRAWCQPPAIPAVRGLVSLPPEDKHPREKWAAERIALPKNPVYLKLGDRPLAWYWNLAMLLGGLLLAAIPEARRHRRRVAAGDNDLSAPS